MTSKPETRHKAIGVFDSGVGGLTVVAALKLALPRERIIYLGDSARVPYGTKSPLTVQRYSAQNARFLLNQGIKLLVIACNTASAVAIDSLRAESPVAVVDVIEPGARRAAEVSRSGRIGVIGTDATVRSEAYTKAVLRLRPDAQVISRPCPLFVPLVEEGWLDTPVTRLVIEDYLEPLASAEVDTLVLGCTHYPLLKPAVGRYMGAGVNLVDSAEAVADEVTGVLSRAGLLAVGDLGPDKFFLTDHSPTFQRAINMFLGREVPEVELIDINSGGGR
jgi:glutamate racemase